MGKVDFDFTWSMVVVPLVPLDKLSSELKDFFPEVRRHQGHWQLRNMDDIMRLAAMRGSPWDLRAAPSAGVGGLDTWSTYPELMTLRHELPMLIQDPDYGRVPALHYIEDKFF